MGNIEMSHLTCFHTSPASPNVGECWGGEVVGVSLMRCREVDIVFDGHSKEAAAERSLPQKDLSKTFGTFASRQRRIWRFDSKDCKGIS